MVNKGVTKKSQGELTYAQNLCNRLTGLSRMQCCRYMIRHSETKQGYDIGLENCEDPTDYTVLLANMPSYALPSIVALIFKFAIVEGFFIKDEKEKITNANSEIR